MNKLIINAYAKLSLKGTLNFACCRLFSYLSSCRIPFHHLISLCILCHSGYDEDGEAIYLDRAAGALQSSLCVEDRWEICLYNCPEIDFRQSIACCKSVRPDMCCHFSLTDCWWAIFSQQRQLTSHGQENKQIVVSLIAVFLIVIAYTAVWQAVGMILSGDQSKMWQHSSLYCISSQCFC